MKTKMRVFLLLPMLLFLHACNKNIEMEKLSDEPLIPAPREIQSGDGVFTITPRTRIIYNMQEAESERIAGYLSDYLSGETGSSTGQHDKQCRHGHDAQTADLDQDHNNGLTEQAIGPSRVDNRQAGNTNRRGGSKKCVDTADRFFRGSCGEHQQNRSGENQKCKCDDGGTCR